MKKILLAAMLVFVLMAGAAPALASDAEETNIVADVLLARPAGLAAIVIGSALFVVSLPVALPSGSVGYVGNQLVLKPVEFTFVRPVGNFNYELGTWKSGWSKEE